MLDEAQHIKNRQTKNAKAVKMLDSERRLVLTGTPVENSVADVWSIFDFLMPGYLGDYETFKANFEEPIADGGAAGEEAQARLRRKLHPFIMRRLKKTVAKDLPDKIVKVSYCPMSEDAQREYNEALAKTRRQAGDAIREKGFAKSKFEILAMLMKLRQISSRAKLEAFLELAATHDVAVATHERAGRSLKDDSQGRRIDLDGIELHRVVRVGIDVADVSPVDAHYRGDVTGSHGGTLLAAQVVKSEELLDLAHGATTVVLDHQNLLALMDGAAVDAANADAAHVAGVVDRHALHGQ